jgi:hypothetical protein
MNGIVVARLDRATLGDFDAFVLGSLLISMFEGQVILPDGGFYLREHHISLIRQGRLIAGITTLSEVSEKEQQALLTIPDKTASRATYEDAFILANYENIEPRTNEHKGFIEDALR